MFLIIIIPKICEGSWIPDVKMLTQFWNSFHFINCRDYICTVIVSNSYYIGVSLGVGKGSAFNAGDLGSIPGLGRSPGEGNGKPLQYSCLENPMDGGAMCPWGCRVVHDWATSLLVSNCLNLPFGNERRSRRLKTFSYTQEKANTESICTWRGPTGSC